jgi:hypothetical protein
VRWEEILLALSLHPAHGFTECLRRELLADLDERVAFVGRLRGDSSVYDPRVPRAPKSKRGPKAVSGLVHYSGDSADFG